MQTKQTAIFVRTRAAFAHALSSFRVRQQVERELNLLSDHALADLGVFRGDIPGFAKDAARIEGSESLVAAARADLKAVMGLSAAANATRRPA